jgi:thiol-disulfide isomerase/thioredoxin
MLRIFLRTFLSSSLAAQGALPAPLAVGDVLPPVALEGLTQTEARSFADFCGRAVLLEFFAHWCGPCALSIPHLNELQEKYGARGFSVVGVTSENAKKTVPWIEKHGAKYAYGYDPSRHLSGLFQNKTIPFAALIDPLGKVVWTGHPARLADQDVERALEGALTRPVWQWPEEARPLAGMLQQGEYAAALALGAKLPADLGFDPQAFARARLEPLLARFAQLDEKEDYAAAMGLGERLEKGLAGLPEGERVAARMRELRADPVVTRQVAAVQRMAELEARASALRNPEEAEKLRVELVTFVERRARTLLEDLDRALERAKKKRR